ncbi:MAG TPA: hypothetical protein VF196_01245 [Casimicrobiaceae bacterium]
MKGTLLVVAAALVSLFGLAPEAHAQAGRTYYCGPNTNATTCGPPAAPGRGNSCSQGGCHAQNPLNDAQGRAMRGAGSVGTIQGSSDAGMQAVLTLYTGAELQAIADWLLTLATSPTPTCTVAASTTTPLTGASVTLTATCSNGPTSYVWTNCTSTTSTCTATSAVAGNRSYSVVASNASGAGPSASVTVAWTAPGTTPTPPPPSPPPGGGETTPPAPPPPTTPVVEYFHSGFGHYFITSFDADIAALDSGRFQGWSRTGRSFKAYVSNGGSQRTVCRFFTEAFAPKSSHFYTSSSAECNLLRNESRDWKYEADAFYVESADNPAGSCPTGTQAVYRLYNNGQTGAPNHRYTTDPGVRADMMARGWIPEGYGPEGVGFCAPF